MPSGGAWSWQTNGTCEGSVDMELLLHYSLIPSLAIIAVLSFLERRASRTWPDGKLRFLEGRFGIVVPLDFVGTFSNRWSFGFAFGATANKVMLLFLEDYVPLQVPRWAQAVVLLIGGTEVGLSHFPLFACLSTESHVAGSVLGFCYASTWLAAMMIYIAQCPHGQVSVFLSEEGVTFLVLVMVPGHWHSGAALPGLQSEQYMTNRGEPPLPSCGGEWAEGHAAEWPVWRRAGGMRRQAHRPGEGQEWPVGLGGGQSACLAAGHGQHTTCPSCPPCPVAWPAWQELCDTVRSALPGQALGDYERIIFYWPSLLCLVFLLGRFALMFAKALRVRLNMDVPREESRLLTVPQAQYVKRLLRKPPERQAQKSWVRRKLYEWDACFQFPGRMIGTSVLAVICLYLFIVIEIFVQKQSFQQLRALESTMENHFLLSNSTEELSPVFPWLGEFINVLQGVWFFTVFAASLTCITYVFHILACYRKHMKRLWAGEKHFLPVRFHQPSSSRSVAAIARYSGWQIAYLLWGYLILHTVQCVFGMFIMYAVVLPIHHGQGLEVAKELGLTILAAGIAVGLVLLQVRVAALFFLQPRIQPADEQKPLALNNRRAFHNFNYFLFFYNVLLGLGACLSRLLCSALLGTWLIARIDRTILQRGYEGADTGFNTWVGMLFMDHYHTNPTLLCFCHVLLVGSPERSLPKATRYASFGSISNARISPQARTRWLLLYSLLNNPQLVALRKPSARSRVGAAPQGPCV
ncbi:stimulated by retinoic acid gene 6 protein-like [Pelodiscus sinensis]|uniref:stimulated by retinoic acid gene 6 protein-like n=1 Tax=Pelodiscus sinensis TaxID=13735 RepID=UPI003F6CAE07